MRRFRSSVPGGLLPFLLGATLLLPGCPLTDGYYVVKDDPSNVGSSAGMAAGGEANIVLSGRGGASSAGATSGAGGKPGAGGASGTGGDNTPDADGCVSVTNQGHEYAFCFTSLIQADARATCGDRGMTLAVIEDQAENAWITATLLQLYSGDSSRAFIGANDVSVEGEWRWADGVVFWRNGAAISGRYTNWSASEPNGESPIAGAADCLTIYHSDGTWADLSCEAELPYVCELR